MPSSAVTIGAAAVAALNGSSDLATLCGVGSMSNPPRVFPGEGGMFWGRNRGRMPFFEVWVRGQSMLRDQEAGGDMESQIVVRAHYGGPTLGTNIDALANLLTAAVKAIRTYVDTNGNAGYLVEGPTTLADVVSGPFDATQDAVLTVRHTLDRTNYTFT